MPPSIDEQIRRNVIRQWITGLPRDTIAAENNIGAGTVSSIISYWKIGLDNSDLDSVRELAIETKRQGLALSELALHFRLHNYIIKSGAAEDKIESFITKVSTEVSPEKVIELVYQLNEISSAESIPLDQVPGYIKQKLEEKQKIDEEIKQADTILQSKNVSIETINEHIQLKKKLRKHGLSTKDIHRLVNLLEAAKEYRYSPGKIVAKLRGIKRLENKETKLRNSVEVLSKKQAKYKEIIPFSEELVALRIGIPELIGLEVAIKEAAKMYNLPFFNSTMQLINDIKTYNKINGLKKELQRLSFQKYALDQACSEQRQALFNLAKLKSNGVTEDRILQLNNFLESNGYQASTYTNTK